MVVFAHTGVLPRSIMKRMKEKQRKLEKVNLEKLRASEPKTEKRANKAELRMNSIRDIKEFIFNKVISPMTLYEIIDLGMPMKFKIWDRYRVSDIVKEMVVAGLVSITSRAAGQRPAKFMSTFNANADSEGVDIFEIQDF